MRRLLTGIIKLYQKTFSPDHSWFRLFFPNGYCKFYPSCSSYSAEAINKYGIFGIWLSIKRVVRCHPWSAGGIDKVPTVSGFI